MNVKVFEIHRFIVFIHWSYNKIKFGYYHEDPEGLENKGEICFIYCPFQFNYQKHVLNPNSEIGYFFYELDYLLFACFLGNRINHKRNSLLKNLV